MNVEAKEPSSTGSPEGERKNTAYHSDDSSRSTSSRSRTEEVNSSSDSDSKSSTSKSSNSYSPIRKADSEEKLNDIDHEKGSDSGTSDSIKEELSEKRDAKKDRTYSESSSSINEKPDYTSSVISESDHDGLLRSILSESSSEKIVTDIDASSPKDGKFSSSTDEELLRKFREQQANRRFRPRSAKFRRDADPEPENIQRVQSRASDRGSSKEQSYSSDSSSSEEEDNSARRRRPKKPRKGSASSSNKSSDPKNNNSSRSPSPSSSTHSSQSESEVETKPTPKKDIPPKPYRSHSSQSRLEEETRITDIPAKPSTPPKESSDSETSDSLTTNPTSPSQSTFIERPPSRQGERPKTSHTGRGRARTRAKPEHIKPVKKLLNKKSQPLSVDSPSNWPKEPGFWWPYNEDTGEKELQRLIEYHRRKLHNLLAQEYLQRHLEIELRRTGAQFKQYERGPRPLSPKQIRKYKERNISWVYVDGKLHSLNQSMGSFNTTQRGRKQSRVTPKLDKSSERSKRSVSFEKGVGRRRSSSRSADNNPLSSLIRKISPKRKQKRKGSGSSSRKSSLSTKSGETTPRSSFSGSGKQWRPISARKKSRSRSRSSSRTSRSSMKSPPPNEAKGDQKRTAARPKTAKRRVRSHSSTSKSSVDRSSTKVDLKKERSSSRSGSERKRSKSKESSSRKNKGKHYAIEENHSLQRVLFTEEFERKLKRKQKEIQTLRPASPKHSTRQVDNDSIPSVGKKKEERKKTAVKYEQTKQVRDEYNFYKDPNIPGHAFPYYYLVHLLSMERGRGSKRSNGNTGMSRIVLKPAPVNRQPAWRTHPVRTRRPSAKLQPGSAGSSPKTRRKKKTKSVINEEEKPARSSSRESGSSSLHNTSSSASHPRIRPGSGPIKCSWKAETEPEKIKYPGSDHQLKNTDNPAILAWLRRKDAQLRLSRQNEIRKQRRKTAKLIDEQNDLDEKHERALQQYEFWKRNKDREILLRRRKEAKEASSAAFAKKENELKTIKRTKERPRTGNGQQKISSGSTFSELRSSSASPNTEGKDKSRKPRPKSATTTLGVSFSDQNEAAQVKRPRSATPLRQTGDKKQSVFQRTENFFKSFLGVGGEKSTDAGGVEVHNTDQHQVVTEDRAAYDKWVRSSTPTKNKDRPKNKKQSKSASPARRNRKKNATINGFPPHDHTENELISNLAKRRIESILANRKRVDSGVKRRPGSGQNGVKKPTPPQGSSTDPTHRKWKLRDDDIIKPQVVKFSSQHSSHKSSSSSSSSSSSKNDEERPKFSYKKKSKSNSVRHERSPVLREAADLNHAK